MSRLRRFGWIGLHLAVVVIAGGAAILTVIQLVGTGIDVLRTQDWVRVAAVPTSYGSYRYTVGGKDYEGDRYHPGHVALWKSSRDDGFRAALASARAEGRKITVLVNLERPSQAMISREASLADSLRDLGIAVTAGLMAVATYFGPLSKALRTPVENFAEILPPPTRGEETRGLVGLWCLAILFSLLGVPWGASIVHRAVAGEGPIVLIELLFLPLPAVLLLAYAVVLTWRRRSRPPSFSRT
jgi:hypothetical protein